MRTRNMHAHATRILNAHVHVPTRAPFAHSMFARCESLETDARFSICFCIFQCVGVHSYAFVCLRVLACANGYALVRFCMLSYVLVCTYQLNNFRLVSFLSFLVVVQITIQGICGRSKKLEVHPLTSYETFQRLIHSEWSTDPDVSMSLVQGERVLLAGKLL